MSFNEAENWTPKMQILYPCKEILQKAEEPNKDNQHVLETPCLRKKDNEKTEKYGLISMRTEKSITSRGQNTN